MPCKPRGKFCEGIVADCRDAAMAGWVVLANVALRDLKIDGQMLVGLHVEKAHKMPHWRNIRTFRKFVAIKRDTHLAGDEPCVLFLNPNGIPPSSPRLGGIRSLGRHPKTSQPQRSCAPSVSLRADAPSSARIATPPPLRFLGADGFLLPVCRFASMATTYLPPWAKILGEEASCLA